MNVQRRSTSKPKAMVGIGVCNNVIASVKRRARLGIQPPTGKRKNARIQKGERYSAVLSKDASEWDVPLTRKGDQVVTHVHFHATKGFRGGAL
jgi:hypothetical protein